MGKKDNQVQVYLDDETHKALKSRAEAEDLPISRIVARIVRDGLGVKPKKATADAR